MGTLGEQVQGTGARHSAGLAGVRLSARARAGRAGSRRTLARAQARGASGMQGAGARGNKRMGVRSARSTGLGAPVHAWVCSARPGWVFCAL